MSKKSFDHTQSVGLPSRHTAKRNVIVFTSFGLLFIVLLFVSFVLGRYSISPKEVFLLIRENTMSIPSDLPANKANVFFNLRLPRVLAAVCVGCGLSLSGCVYQGAFRNPMVSPDILGATQGAGLGAAVALLLDFDMAGVQLTAFAGGLLAVLWTYLFARIFGDKGNSTLSLVLTGIVVSALFQSGISLIKYVGDPYTKLPAITFWLMGSLSSIIPDSLPMLYIPLVIGIIPLFLQRWKLNLLSLNDEEAMSLGVNISRMRLMIILCATLITSSVVAVSGMIGWVGLIIPHLARMLVGSDGRVLLPASMLLGGSFLLLVDDIARSATAMDIPLGILTALIGAPFFLFLMYREREARR